MNIEPLNFCWPTDFQTPEEKLEALKPKRSYLESLVILFLRSRGYRVEKDNG